MHSLDISSLDINSLLWQPEQLAGESRQAYEAFRVYREMPATKRSLQAVAKRVRKSRSLIERWSAKHHWADRIRNRKDRVASERIRADEAERQKIRKSNWDIATLYAATYLEGVSALLKRIPDLEGYAERLPAPRLFPFIVRLFRASRSVTRAQIKLIEHIRSEGAGLTYANVNPEPSGAEEELGEPDLKPVMVTVEECACKYRHFPQLDQWPCESAKAYRAFTLHCGLGTSRSIRRTAEQSNLHRSQIQRWAKRYMWDFRIREYEHDLRSRLGDPELCPELKKHFRTLKLQFAEAEALQAILTRVTNVCIRRLPEVEQLDLFDLIKLMLKWATVMCEMQDEMRHVTAFFDGAELKRPQFFDGVEMKRSRNDWIFEISEKAPDFSRVNEILAYCRALPN